MNPVKKIKMLKRRLHSQQDLIVSLEERNFHLVTELNNSKISLANMTDEYNKLMKKNYDQAVEINHNKAELVKLRNAFEEQIISALKSLGTTSEVLLNLKRNLNEVKFGTADYRPDTSLISSPSLTRNEVSFQDVPNDNKRNQAAVSPMVEGYVIGNPTITLQRLRISPDEVYARTRPRLKLKKLKVCCSAESPVAGNGNNRCDLSPIEEEPPPPTEHVRSRLGTRNLGAGSGTRISDFIPEAHSEPVVRLSDVSRLLSNTSWLSLNFSPQKEKETTSSPPDELPNSSASRTVKLSPTATVTIRPRKKAKRKNELVVNENDDNNGGDDNKNESTTSDIVVDANNRNELVENEVKDESTVLVNSSPANNNGEPSHLDRSPEINDPQQCEADNNINNFDEQDSLSIIDKTIEEIITQIQPMEEFQMSQLRQDNGDENMRPRSKRVKKPSRKILESDLIVDKIEAVNNSKKSLIRKSRISKRTSTRLEQSCSVIAENEVSTLTESTSKRTSSRIRKPIKYINEPFTSQEMKKILRKGLSKKV